MTALTATKSPKDKNAEHTHRLESEQTHRPTLSNPQPDILDLHRTAGNRAVMQLLQAGTATEGTIHAKLNVSHPGDRDEQEADRIAEDVMRMPELQVQRQPVPEEEEEEDETLQMKPLSAQITSLVQRQTIPDDEEEEVLQSQTLTEEAEDEDEEEMLQAKGTAAQAPAVTPSIEAGIEDVLSGGGRPLDPATRVFMEPRFGHNFEQVRVYSGPRAAAAARAVNARAFTVGRDVVFGAGQYVPRAAEGQRLLAHELAHVVQLTAPVQRTPMVQRQKEATGKEEAAESPVWEQLVDDFTSYIFGMAQVNQQYPTVTRRQWSAAFEELWAEAGEPGERTDAELLELRRAFEELEDLFVNENTAANEIWLDLMRAYETERADLVASDFIEDVVALDLLNELFKKTDKRVTETGEYLVSEDLVALHYMLENQTHITRGMKEAEREMKRRRRLEEEFAEEEAEEGPSALGVAWDIVGWDSAGDFALDVVLTIITGGLGKVTKILVKGRKAKKKLEKLKKLDRLRKLRKAKRLDRLLEGTTKLVRSVAEVLENFDAPSYIDWIKGNWKRTLRSYITDELGEALSGGKPAESKNVLERLSKDAVGEYVSRLLRISSSAEKEQFQAAVLAFAGGLSSAGKRELRRYFVMNLKRRGLSNAVYYGARVGVGETKLSAEVAVDVAASTGGEMAQDFVSRIAPGVPETLVETARKSVQNSVASSIKNALT